VLTAGAQIGEREVRVSTLLPVVGSALSQDRSRLFFSTHDERPDDSQQRLLYSHINELDLATGGTDLVEDAWSATYYGPSLQFSQDGRWLFFIDADAKSIDAYDLLARRSYRVPGTFGTITQLALL
jgi:hypothetical protein